MKTESTMVNKQEFINKACEVLDLMLYMWDCGDYDCVATAYDDVEEFINEFKKINGGVKHVQNKWIYRRRDN